MKIGKKASIDDKLYVFGILFVIVIGMVALNLFWEPTYDVLTGLGSESVNDALANVNPSDVSSWMDWMIVFGYFGLNIAVCLILPLFVNHNPFFMIGIFIFSFAYTYGVAVSANVLYDWLSSVGSTFTYTMLMVENLVIIEVVFILLMGLIMFFKFRNPTEAYYS